MSSRFWKITLLTLAWTQTLGLTVLLVYIRDYQPVIVDQRAVAHPITSPHAYSRVMDAANSVEHEQDALDAALNGGSPDHPVNADSHFDNVIRSLDGLDQAWALFVAESTFVSNAGPGASLPLTQILGAMLAVMMLVAVAVTTGVGTRGSVIGGSELVRAPVGRGPALR